MECAPPSLAPDFIAVIPARMDSTRLPGKPLADIGGKPMVVRVAECAARSGAHQIVVATDSLQIIEACRDHGIEAMLTRNDHPSGTDRIAEVASRLDLPDEAIVVNVQGDEPLVPPSLIAGVARHLTAHPDCAIATAAHAIDTALDVFNPNIVKTVLDARGRALLFSRAPLPWFRDGYAGDARPAPATLSMPVYRHIGLYAYRAGFLRRYPELSPAPLEQAESLEQLRAMWHGERIAVLIAEEAPAGGVDTPEDLDRVRLKWTSGMA